MTEYLEKKMNNDRFYFRVFDKGKNEYIDGHMCVGQGGKCIIDANVLQEYEESSRYIIEQSTGLCDKNGNLIYEGDLLKCVNKCWDSKTGKMFIECKTGTVKREENGKYYIENENIENLFYSSDLTFHNKTAEIISKTGH